MPRTLNEAAWELEAIRNDRTTEANLLLARCDAVGRWLSRKQLTSRVRQLLREAHQLSERLVRRAT
jgi:hypothetical protein